MTQEHQYFERLYREHHRYVLHLLNKLYVHREQDQMDCAQTVWLTVALKLDEYDGKSKFQSWLRGIVIFIVKDYHRLCRRRPLDLLPDLHALAALGSPEMETVGPWELRTTANETLAEAIPDRARRTAYFLREVYGFDGTEIAPLTGTPGRTVQWQLQRAEKDLDEYRNRGRNFQAAALFLGFGSTEEAWKHLWAWGSSIPEGFVPFYSRWTWKSVVGTSVSIAASVTAVVLLLLLPPSRSRSTAVAETPPVSVSPLSGVPSHNFSAVVGPLGTVLSTSTSSLPAPPPRVRAIGSAPSSDRLDDSRLALLRVRKALNTEDYLLAQRLLDAHQVRFGTFDAPARNEYRAEARRNQSR